MTDVSDPARPGRERGSMLTSIPFPIGFRAARLLVERNVRAGRNAWQTMLTGFLEPVFYLFSLGVGIGALVGGVRYGGHLVRYQEFVAPGLLAASAMNGAVMDSTFNVFFKLKYARIYDSVLATPLDTRAIAVGEVTWALLRGAGYAAMFIVILLISGYVTSWWALLALPAATLIGLAFAGVGMAATTWMRSWQDFDLVQLATLPMFLFSATFYPLSAYPHGLRLVVELTPLYHAVDLERQLLLGAVNGVALVHVAYLVALGLAGMWIARGRLERLLLS